MTDAEKALREFIKSGALATNQCPEYLRDAYFRAGFKARNLEIKELEARNKALEMLLDIIIEMKNNEDWIEQAKKLLGKG